MADRLAAGMASGHRWVFIPLLRALVLYQLYPLHSRNHFPNITGEFKLGNALADFRSSHAIAAHQKQNFTRSFAMESVRRILMWRLRHLLPLSSVPLPPNLHLLPPSIKDPFGRPIIIMNELASAGNRSVDFKEILGITLERLRIYLKEINKMEGPSTRPVLQYVVLLDLEGISIRQIVRRVFLNLYLYQVTRRNAESGFTNMDNPRNHTTISGNVGSWYAQAYTTVIEIDRCFLKCSCIIIHGHM